VPKLIPNSTRVRIKTIKFTYNFSVFNAKGKSFFIQWPGIELSMFYKLSAGFFVLSIFG
jgi:hypothetical protein